MPETPVLTEDDVVAMETVVLATPTNPAVEHAWACKARDELRTAEQFLMAEWRMHRHSRQDAKMAAAATLLARVRVDLAYVETLLDKEAATPPETPAS